MSLRNELYVKAKEAQQRKEEEELAKFQKRLEDSKEGLLKIEGILRERAEKGCFSMGFDEDYLIRLKIPNDIFIHFSKENGFRMSTNQSFGGFKTFTIEWGDDD